MKFLKRFFLGIAAFVVGALVIAFFLPSTTHIVRTSIVRAPVDQVYMHVIDLREWSSWSPWYEVDPRIKVTFSDTPTGQGAWMVWDSRKRQIDGSKVEIARVENNKSIDLDVLIRDKNPATMRWDFTPVGQDSTQVLLTFHMKEKNLLEKWKNQFRESRLENRLERGLNNLRRLEEVKRNPLPKSTKEILRERVDSALNRSTKKE